MKTDNQDEWGKDPAVRAMRTIFRSMEQAQTVFFERMDIAPYDTRIRSWREKALTIFEKVWEAANRIGVSMDVKTTPKIYVHCLAGVMDSDGVEISSDSIPPLVDEADMLLKEVLK
jgi:hypothetical protein